MTLNFSRLALPLIAILALPAYAVAGASTTNPFVNDKLQSETLDKYGYQSKKGVQGKFSPLGDIHQGVFKKYSDKRAISKFEGVKKQEKLIRI
ncbi:hypothetical protein A9Q83_16245 [Alphaproteobacteria bacterium 46_93_T64]|nr:hypothetical protein A9Q83_16245 [Alphaproteobacteria bacterium 46_93_T64]